MLMDVLPPRIHNQVGNACLAPSPSTWFTPKTTSAHLEGSVAQQVVSVHLKPLGLSYLKQPQMRTLRGSVKTSDGLRLLPSTEALVRVSGASGVPPSLSPRSC